ncbi:hypothetical protein [Imhoffiella purpurea]|uniref:Uncharacterized protein n=1 Tax=Imhoffiella purpurea TaxID=1249627 RepID=W9V5R5_9GAMM|nr:hypothetical protein [Imhoffiella purpurea]EXJ14863.1 hypothetical protein D779_2069 [Imhoffiella purpurea]
MKSASDLFDLAAGLRSITIKLVEHSDDKSPSEMRFGLCVAAEHLATDLAAATWELVEADGQPQGSEHLARLQRLADTCNSGQIDDILFESIELAMSRTGRPELTGEEAAA